MGGRGTWRGPSIHTLFLTADGAVLRLARHTVRLRFHGGNRAAAIEALDQLAGRSWPGTDAAVYFAEP